MQMKLFRSLKGPLAGLTAGIVALAGVTAISTFAQAQQPKTVKIGVIVPLSGAWARQGQLVKMGAETAVAEINAAGGIKALGGAKLELVSADAGDSAEKAKNAAQRLIAQEPDLVGGMGSWLSTFTLAVTEVTERAQVPWLTLSYADSITGRGFKHVFQSSPPAGTQSTNAVPTIIELGKAATGAPPKTAGVIGDNTASPVAFLKPMREGGLEKMGMKIVLDETYTPPLSDATPLVQKIRSARPEFLLFITSTIPDLKLSLEKMNEFRLGKGTIPTIGNGAHNGAPEVAQERARRPARRLHVHRRELGPEGPGADRGPLQEADRRAVDHAGRSCRLRPHLDPQGGAGKGRRCRQGEGLRSHPQHGDQERPGGGRVSRRREVRRGRPPRRRAARHRAVAERRAGFGLSDRPRPREGEVAEELRS